MNMDERPCLWGSSGARDADMAVVPMPTSVINMVLWREYMIMYIREERPALGVRAEEMMLLSTSGRRGRLVMRM